MTSRFSTYMNGNIWVVWYPVEKSFLFHVNWMYLPFVVQLTRSFLQPKSLMNTPSSRFSRPLHLICEKKTKVLRKCAPPQQCHVYLSYCLYLSFCVMSCLCLPSVMSNKRSIISTQFFCLRLSVLKKAFLGSSVLNSVLREDKSNFFMIRIKFQ